RRILNRRSRRRLPPPRVRNAAAGEAVLLRRARRRRAALHLIRAASLIPIDGAIRRQHVLAEAVLAVLARVEAVGHLLARQAKLRIVERLRGALDLARDGEHRRVRAITTLDVAA